MEQKFLHAFQIYSALQKLYCGIKLRTAGEKGSDMKFKPRKLKYL